MTPGTLSVLLPNFNHARYLPDALSAVLSQGRAPDELIVVDDCSTDHSVEIIEAVARVHPNVTFVRNERNRGIEYSFNLAMSMATGEYVCGIASDDRLLPGFFERALRLLARYPQAALCSARSTVIDAENDAPLCCLPLELVSHEEAFISPSAAIAWLRRHEPWTMGNACIYQREALLAEGGFIRELRSFCDGFMQMVLAAKHGACFIPEPLGVWRLSATGYASVSQSDVVQANEMWRHAAHLMRTRYTDVFPADFVDEWEKQRLCEAHAGSVLRPHQHDRGVLRYTGRRLRLLASMGVQWARGDATAGRVAVQLAKSAWRRRRSRRLAAITLSHSSS